MSARRGGGADPRAAQALEYIEEQIRDLEARIAELKGAANGVARAAGLPAVYAPSGARIESGPEPPPATMVEVGEVRASITPGQFAGYPTLAEAAKAFFVWRGRALGFVSLDELLSNLTTGGAPFRRKDAARDELRISLGQDKEIARLRNDYYGLARWLEHRGKRSPTPRSSG